MKNRGPICLLKSDKKLKDGNQHVYFFTMLQVVGDHAGGYAHSVSYNVRKRRGLTEAGYEIQMMLIASAGNMSLIKGRR